MNSYRVILGMAVLMTVLMTVMLAGSGCMRAVTAPMRAERREKAEAAFDRIAALTPEQIAGFLDHRMAARLALTDEQRPRVGAINLEHAGKLRAIAVADDGIRAKARAMGKQNDVHETALRGALTSEQFTRFLESKEEMREALKDAAQSKK